MSVTGAEDFCVVVPTRDDPQRCRQLLQALLEECERTEADLRVVFLVNDTQAAAKGQLEEAVMDERFAALRPRLLYATENRLTVEENILHTLGDNLHAVGERFVILGNSDRLHLDPLRGALAYMDEHSLELLLIGWLNREVYEGATVREINLTPRLLGEPKALNRLSEGGGPCHGSEVFAAVFSDYGPEGHLSYIGCQIYTKPFFRTFCEALAALPEPLYSIPVALLALTMRQRCAVGWWPEVTVTRIDHLRYGADVDAQPADWWIPRSRTSRRLSRHCILSIVANSLRLSPEAFATLVNCEMVCNRRATPYLEFTNFLYSFVEQIRNINRNCPGHPEWRYSPGELQVLVEFGRRLAAVEIGLAEAQREAISRWFQSFEVIGDYSDLGRLQNLMVGAPAVLLLLEARPGMGRMVVEVRPEVEAQVGVRSRR